MSGGAHLWTMVRRLCLAVLALTALVAGAGAADAPAVISGTAAVNGIEMYYEVRGAGEPLLLLHGGFANTAHWREQFDDFAAHYRVIAVDSRGHGRTSLGDAPLGYRLMADDVLALMDHLGIARAHLVGWSDGGNIGLDIAIRAPERLDRLVAYGANFAPEGVRADAADNPRFTAFIAQAREDYQRLSPAPERWDTFVERIHHMWATEPRFTEAELGAISTPVLVLDGLEEEAIYIEHVKALAGLIPGADLVLMPDTGHFAQLEQPAAFNRIVLDFLAR
jgi:pimeloyl-ACP methyl ester carboxylesterase